MLVNPAVSLGNNRNNGANLGIAYVNGNNGLVNSNGNNWRARLFQNSTVERRRVDLTAEPETPLKAFDTRSVIRAVRVAVKDVHKGPASRAERSRKAVARWEIAA